MRIAHLDPFSGASGDMLLGALIDAGVQAKAITDVLDGLELPGWSISVNEVTRGGIGATSVTVALTAPDTVIRTWSNVRALLTGAALPERVRQRALRAFQRLADAEARIHRIAADRVHFHEVGAVDAIVDIVGVCAGFALLGVDRVTASPVAQGTGMTRSAHGLLPIPAPAVLELLHGAPIYTVPVTAELCTPTGAALLAELVDDWEPLPRMAVESIGYGAGSRDLDHPNTLRLIVGEAASAPTAEVALVLETTVDDLPGELVPPVLEALRTAGASDAWARPVLMKKGRPGLELVCMGPPDRGEALRRVLFSETTTLGVRGRLVEKWMLERDWVTVEVAGHPVRLKVGRLEGAVTNIAPEYEDCARVAEATGLPLKEVYAIARAAWPGESGLDRTLGGRPQDTA